MADAGDISVTRRNGALVIRLSGAWTLEAGIPPADPIRAELERSPTRSVAFDSERLAEWDSALVTFLVRVGQICTERGIAMERDGLPAGAQRLLRLAEAVPERPGTRRGTERAPW